MGSIAIILMNSQILVNNLLDFHSHKQPKPSLFISSNIGRATKPYSKFPVLKTTLLSHSRETQMPFVPSFFSNKAAVCISSRFHCRTIAFVIYTTDFTAKKPSINYFVIRCEAKFSKVRLEIFQCTCVKCLLETNLAFSVKQIMKYRACPIHNQA